MTSSHDIYTQVGEHYSAASRSSRPAYEKSVAASFGYSEEELANVPEGANLGVSCGNPLALASIAEGETVIDFGSGAGFDVFQAARKVGDSGKAIGVDMNKDMLAKANKIKSDFKYTNVDFVESRITDVSVLSSGIADCLISNCVVNLVPAEEKHLVFREMFRLLKKGGRVAVSDILARKPLPESLRGDIAMYVGCIAGASQVSEYDAYLRDAGFSDVLIADTKSDLNVYLDTKDDGSRQTECCVPSSNPGPSTQVASPDTGCCSSKADDDLGTSSGNLPDLNEWVGSFKVYAVKR